MEYWICIYNKTPDITDIEQSCELIKVTIHTGILLIVTAANNN